MVTELSYIIVEDEFYALENLRRTISSLRPQWQPVFTAESVAETVRFFSQGGRCDLAFMDIELVDGNCFDIFSQTDVDVPVIFTTAYDQYAIKAFKVNSVDYLLKPVSEEAALGAVLKFEKNREAGRAGWGELMARLSVIGRQHGRDRLLISRGDEYTYVNVEEVAYFVSEEKYVFAVDFKGSRMITEYTNLNVLAEDIGPKRFFRCSRNLVISLESIRHVRKYFNGRLKITVKDGQQTISAVVSAARRDDFLKWFGGGAGDSRL